MTGFFIKVDSPDFQLPQVVLDNLPDWATMTEVQDAIVAYYESLPPAVSPAALSYTFTQPVPLATWVINHPLPYSPNVTITDSAGTVVATEIVYVSPTVIHSIAAGAFSGTARLS